MPVAAMALGAGCASIQRSMGLEPARSSVQIEETQFEPTVRVLGLTARQNDSPQNVYYLRSWVAKKDGRVDHQLYVHDVYKGDWKFWERANADDATALNVVSIDQHVGTCTGAVGCELKETFGVDISESMLRSHPNGFPVKVYAQRGGDMIITLSPQQISAQLAATDSIAARYRPK
jgi:hypothetical protein